MEHQDMILAQHWPGGCGSAEADWEVPWGRGTVSAGGQGGACSPPAGRGQSCVTGCNKKIFLTWQKNIFIWWHFTSWVVAGCWSPASYSAQAHWRWTWRLHLRSYCFLFWFQNHLWRTVRAPTIKMKQITTLHCLLPIDMQSKWSQFCEIKVWISIVALVTSRGSEDKAS